MSRQSVQTLPNVMLEKGLFDDLKILDLMETCGCIGFTVYVSLLMKIADDKGYYTQMSPSLIAAIQRDIGSKWVSRDKIIGVINVLPKCELLDSSLFTQGVLTSVGIQRRYLDVKVKSRARGYSIKEYWLLSEKAAGNPIEYNNSEIVRNNPDKCSNNSDKCNNNSLCKDKSNNNNDDIERYLVDVMHVAVDCRPLYSLREYMQAADALHKSKWATANLTHLSKIHRLWNKILSGYYTDFTAAKAEIRPRSETGIISHDYAPEEVNRVFDELDKDPFGET